jgi:hypothetical protein
VYAFFFSMPGEQIKIYIRARREGLRQEHLPKVRTDNPKVKRATAAVFEELQKARLIAAEVGHHNPFGRVEPVTPDEADLDQIPKWALAAFAGRCAQRGLPNSLLPRSEEEIGEHFSALEQTVAFVMDCAESSSITELPPLARIQFYPEYPDSAVVAVMCAALTPFGVTRSDNLRLAALAADHANWAVWWHPESERATLTDGFKNAAAVNTAIWTDFGSLSEAALEGDWTDATPVPRRFLNRQQDPDGRVYFFAMRKRTQPRQRRSFIDSAQTAWTRG